MTTIVTRAAKGSPLTNNEVDANAVNLKATADAALPKAGGVMSGAITTNSTFDGRDVATDGTKLDGVEASADVTDTANVTAAGALMDSELTAIASVKALNQGVATGDSPTFVNVTATSLDISGDIDVDGTTNLDVVDIDGAVDMASTLAVGGLVTVTGNVDASGTFLAGSSDSIFAENNLAFKSSGSAYIDHHTVDADIIFRTSDASALDTTALTLDGSAGGAATFSSTIAATGATLSGALELDASGNIPTNGIALHTNNFVYLKGGSSGLIASSQSGGENFRLNANGIVFNEDSGDLDFRVESNGNTHMLFVDGGNNHIGMGTATLNRSGLGADHICLTVGADTQMGMLELQGTRTSNADLGRVSFLNAGTRRAEIVAARIDADNSTKLYFQTSNAGSLGTRLTIGKDGAATFNNGIRANRDIASFGANTGSSANRMALSMEGSGVSRLICNGPDGSTNGTFEVFTAYSGGTGSVKLGIAANGAVIVGSAVASTNVEFNLNGVASKAQRIQFQEGGVNRWLLGQGAASETSAFELYNATGTIALSVDRSTNAATFNGDVSVPNLSVADDIRHTGDSDTYISFEANNQTYYSGGTRALDLASGSAVFNEGGGDVDFRVESDTFSDALSVDGADGHTTIGSGRFSIGAGAARSQFISERSAPSGTNVTSIVSIGNANAMSSAAAAACTIYGSDNAGHSFMDVVHYVASQSAVVISSSTMAGSPKSRTYVVAGAVLRVTMGSGASGYAINTSAQVLQYPF